MAAYSRLRVDLLPCPDLRKKRYRPGLSDSPAEVESRLLVAAGVKLPPQLEQKIGHLRQHRLSAMAVPLQNPFPEAAKVPLILPPQRVAGGTVAIGDDLLPAAPAVKRPLSSLIHRYAAQGFNDSTISRRRIALIRD